MSQKQLQRIVVIENAVAGRVSVGEAAEALGRSARQVKRLKQIFDCSEPSWVLHGNQSRVPVNRTPEELRRRIIELARGKYAGSTTRTCARSWSGRKPSRSAARRYGGFCGRRDCAHRKSGGPRNTVRAGYVERRKECCC